MISIDKLRELSGFGLSLSPARMCFYLCVRLVSLLGREGYWYMWYLQSEVIKWDRKRVFERFSRLVEQVVPEQ